MDDATQRTFKVRFACGLWQRLKGLLPNGAQLDENEVLVLAPCKDIHTFGMERSIDVALLDKHGVVVKSYIGLAPQRRIRHPQAVCVIERISMDSDDRGEVPDWADDEPGWFKTGQRISLSALESGRMATEGEEDEDMSPVLGAGIR